MNSVGVKKGFSFYAWEAQAFNVLGIDNALHVKTTSDSKVNIVSMCDVVTCIL